MKPLEWMLQANEPQPDVSRGSSQTPSGTTYYATHSPLVPALRPIGALTSILQSQLEHGGK
jgi:hypothetical protein